VERVCIWIRGRMYDDLLSFNSQVGTTGVKNMSHDTCMFYYMAIGVMVIVVITTLGAYGILWALEWLLHICDLRKRK